jgi:hypothetical protein
MAREYGLGRLIAPTDARDRAYPLRLLTRAVAPKPRKRPYNEGPVLDQGATPQCVGYSARGVLNAAPIMVKPTTGPTATDLYRTAQRLA